MCHSKHHFLINVNSRHKLQELLYVQNGASLAKFANMLNKQLWVRYLNNIAFLHQVFSIQCLFVIVMAAIELSNHKETGLLNKKIITTREVTAQATEQGSRFHNTSCRHSSFLVLLEQTCYLRTRPGSHDLEWLACILRWYPNSADCRKIVGQYITIELNQQLNVLFCVSEEHSE